MAASSSLVEDDVNVCTTNKSTEDRKTKLKIALIGETGSGKTSFIRAIQRYRIQFINQFLTILISKTFHCNQTLKQLVAGYQAIIHEGLSVVSAFDSRVFQT